MKMMKKKIVLLMGILLVFSLAACGSQDNGNENESPQPADGDSEVDITQELSSVEPEDETLTEEPLESSDTQLETEEGKTLVVYYSASGNTEEAAGYIAEAAGADLFELVPVNPYSDADLDWTDDSSRVVYEHEHPDDRAVELAETTVSDWDSYDTVFIGYPIWWGIAAWPVDAFIEANDFTGKTVIPFCTSASSGLGESGELLEEAAGSGEWLEGERFSSGVSQEEVQSWVEGLGL